MLPEDTPTFLKKVALSGASVIHYLECNRQRWILETLEGCVYIYVRAVCKTWPSGVMLCKLISLY